MDCFLLSNQYMLSVILCRNLSTRKALRQQEGQSMAVVLGVLATRGNQAALPRLSGTRTADEADCVRSEQKTIDVCFAARGSMAP